MGETWDFAGRLGILSEGLRYYGKTCDLVGETRDHLGGRGILRRRNGMMWLDIVFLWGCLGILWDDVRSRGGMGRRGGGLEKKWDDVGRHRVSCGMPWDLVGRREITWGDGTAWWGSCSGSSLAVLQQTMEALAQASGIVIEGPIKAACRDLIVPGFERACQSVFSQINQTFQRGTQECTSPYALFLPRSPPPHPLGPTISCHQEKYYVVILKMSDLP